MDNAALCERVERVIATRADAAPPVDALSLALRDVRELRSFLAASEADLARRLAGAVSCPEAVLAESSKESLHHATKTLDRASTLDAVPALADALDATTVTAGHVDAVTRASKLLDDDRRGELFERVGELVDVAAAASVDAFGRRMRDEARRIAAAAGVDRLERQVRDTTLSSWVDPEGMWNLRGKFDPVTGMKLNARLEAAVETLFAEATPESCPTDPVAKHKHLNALALARLLDDEGSGVSGRRPGRPEFIAVIDIAAPPADTGTDTGAGRRARSGSESESGFGSGGPNVEWPIPIEVPTRVLAELLDDADVNVVVVRNGVVLHAPGELNLGRTTRLANRAQRRALRSLYRTSAIPGCATGYDRCKLHHIIWWRHGGRTDLDNLIPVCSHHHHKIHDAGWNITLGANRELTVTFPDGTVRNTGPPRRLAA